MAKKILQTLKPNHYMNNDLKKRIKQFNKIKFANDKGKRIIIASLKPVGTVTTAPNNN